MLNISWNTRWTFAKCTTNIFENTMNNLINWAPVSKRRAVGKTYLSFFATKCRHIALGGHWWAGPNVTGLVYPVVGRFPSGFSDVSLPYIFVVLWFCSLLFMFGMFTVCKTFFKKINKCYFIKIFTNKKVRLPGKLWQRATDRSTPDSRAAQQQVWWAVLVSVTPWRWPAVSIHSDQQL